MIRIAFCQTNRLFILLERAETEIHFALANSMFKPKMEIDRHGPRLMPNCKSLNPTYFSLPTTFKKGNLTNTVSKCRTFWQVIDPDAIFILYLLLVEKSHHIFYHKIWTQVDLIK